LARKNGAMNWRPILLLLMLSGPAWADIPFAPPAPAGASAEELR